MARAIISIKQLRYADLLASYLKSQNIPVTVATDTEKNSYQIVLDDDSQYAIARDLCQEFVNNPNHKKYQVAAWQHSERTNVPISGPSPRSYRRWLVAMRRAPFTSLVLLLCSIIFAASLLGLFTSIASWLQILPFEQLVTSQQWWRLIGPAFIHFSAVHFIFNLLWWSMLGAQVERKFGSSFLLLLFVFTALVSNVAQLLISGPNFGGLSGVVYGLVGFVWIVGVLKPRWGLQMPTPIVGFMLIWLVLGYADVLWVNMANSAHTAGLLCGCALAWLTAVGSGITPRSE